MVNFDYIYIVQNQIMRTHEIEDQLKGSTVRIIRRTKGEFKVLGTGFWVTQSLLVTCYHVVKHLDPNKIEIQPYFPLSLDPNSSSKICRLNFYLKEPADIAILEVIQSKEESHHVSLLSGLSKIGRNTPLICWGFSDDYPTGHRTECKYEHTIIYPPFFGYELKEGNLMKGFSGGPVLNLITGEVVGIVKGRKNGSDRSKITSMYSVYRALQGENLDLLNLNREFHSKYTYWSELLPNTNKTHYLTKLPPKRPFYFQERDDIHFEINQLLNQAPNKVILHGIKGIGKTSIAADFLYKVFSQYNYICWCNCSNGIKAGMVDDVKFSEISINFSKNEDQIIEHNFAVLITRLQNLEGKKLLILDGVDKNVEKKEIPALSNWDVLITTKLNELVTLNHAIKIEALSGPAAKELFLSIYTREQDSPFIDELLKQVFYHTLAVELLAKNLKSLPAQATIEWYYKEVIQKGILNTPQGKIESTYSKNGEEDTLKKILGGIFIIKDLPVSQINLLLLFSVLPPDYISLDLLSKLFNLKLGAWHSEKYIECVNNLNSLYENGWIEKDEIGNNSVYKLHQLVSESIRLVYEPTEKEEYYEIAPVLLNILDESENNQEILKYLKYVEFYLSKLDHFTEIEIELLLSFMYVMEEMEEYQKMLHLGNKSIKILEVIEDQDTQRIILGQLINCCTELCLPKKKEIFIQKQSALN